MNTEHVIDFDNLVLTGKEVFEDWEDLIVENEGHYTAEDQFLFFAYKGSEVMIGFTLSISGDWWYTPSSYMEPAEGQVNITGLQIQVDLLSIADREVELDGSLKKTLQAVVEKYISL